MNKVKGNIKVNIVDPPGFGPTRMDAIEDLSILSGSTVINEELGDDLDLITVDHLGEVEFSVTDDKNTTITLSESNAAVLERIVEVQSKISEENNGFMKKKLEQRLSTLSGSVGVVKVGADSKVELKEKKDRVEDAIYATKAALKEGIVSGGGIALLNASQKISPTNVGYAALLEAIKSPYQTILNNAGIEVESDLFEGHGINVITGEVVNMVESGIIDPVLVTKTALKNAVSVALTIVSADCVISNVRVNESN